MTQPILRRKISPGSIEAQDAGSSDLEIAQDAELKPIAGAGKEIGLLPEELELYGTHKAKLPWMCSSG